MARFLSAMLRASPDSCLNVYTPEPVSEPPPDLTIAEHWEDRFLEAYIQDVPDWLGIVVPPPTYTVTWDREGGALRIQGAGRRPKVIEHLEAEDWTRPPIGTTDSEQL